VGGALAYEISQLYFVAILQIYNVSDYAVCNLFIYVHHMLYLKVTCRITVVTLAWR